MAQLDKSNNKLLAAMMNIQFAKMLLNSGGDYYHNLIEQDVLFNTKVWAKECLSQNIFPFEISQIPSKPKIQFATVSKYNFRIYPSINLLVDNPNSDTLSMKKQGEEISKYIDEYIPKLSTYGDGIIYNFYASTDKHKILYLYVHELK